MMTEPNPDPAETAADPTSLTRRALFGAAAMVGGAGLMSVAASTRVAAAPIAFPESLAAAVPGLVYVSLDAFAFDVAGLVATEYRLYQDATGMQPEPSARYINAALTIPVGSIVRQINVGYQGQPVVSIVRRDLTGTLANLTPPTSLAAGGGAKTQSLAVDGELTPGASYAVRAFCSSGDSILGMTIGYIPPAQAFVPYTGSTPRAVDTRPNGRLAPFEEIVVDLSGRVITTGRAAVINLTATETGGPGFLAVFSDAIVYPGNSSVNFVAAGQTIANGVISAMSNGKIRVRTGPASSHVLVDVIGTLL